MRIGSTSEKTNRSRARATTVSLTFFTIEIPASKQGSHPRSGRFSDLVTGRRRSYGAPLATPQALLADPSRDNPVSEPSVDKRPNHFVVV
jgi:hypothetical protein